MDKIESNTVRNESQSSIEITKSAKGKYSLAIKIYDFNDERLKLRLIDVLNFVEKEIKAREKDGM